MSQQLPSKDLQQCDQFLRVYLSCIKYIGKHDKVCRDSFKNLIDCTKKYK
jgi:hypothetical protein